MLVAGRDDDHIPSRIERLERKKHLLATIEVRKERKMEAAGDGKRAKWFDN